MSEHIIQNPVPTPDQLAEMLGVSADRVEKLRLIMRSPVNGFVQRKRNTGSVAMKKATGYRKASGAATVRNTARGKTEAR